MSQNRPFPLPLFPLQSVVLYPGMVLPLHIFEERYQLLVHRCLSEQQPFGVVLIYEGQEFGDSAIPHPVGTTARIINVEHLAGGRMNIMVIGGERFQIHDYANDAEPYLMGTVTLWPDELGDRGQFGELIGDLRQNFAEYFTLVMSLVERPQPASHFKLPDDPTELSYHVAANLHIDPEEKQSLLEISNTRERLQRELSLLRREGSFLQRLASLQGQLEADDLSWSGLLYLN
ncbi:MAG: LON peptidase substrate-binding domain-containing protein [Anaerolineae bacterium]